MPLDDPIKGNGGAGGFGIEFPTSTKTEQLVSGVVRVTPDPAVAKISKLELWVEGNLQETIPIQGEWELRFIPEV